MASYIRIGCNVECQDNSLGLSIFAEGGLPAVSGFVLPQSANVDLYWNVKDRGSCIFDGWYAFPDGFGEPVANLDYLSQATKKLSASESIDYFKDKSFTETTLKDFGVNAIKYNILDSHYYWLIAKYRRLEEYTITYEPGTNGTGSQQTQQKTENNTATLKGAIFTRTGYTQTGWATSDGGSKAYNLSATYSGNANLTLYPVWTVNTYTVTFNANGGSVSQTSKSVTYDSTYGDLPTPTRTGYVFNGWYTAASGGTQVTSSTAVEITMAQTLYARWTASTYTVTFNANGGSVSQTSKTVTYDSTYGDLPTPTRIGYTFNGWYTAASGGTKITATTKVSITSAQTLYAQWTANKYTVTFNVNGGGSVSPTSKSVTYNSTYGDLPTPTRKGYAFLGWYTAASGGTEVTSGTKVSIVNDQTLYARWSAETYTVTFDKQGGAGGTDSAVVEYNAAMSKIVAPQKTGYDFKGYYTAVNGGGEKYYNEDGSYAKKWDLGNVTLYACWAIKKYTITFYANGGEGSGSYELDYGAELSAPSVERTGYTLAGWNPEVPSVVPAKDATYIAQWTANTYTVRFHRGLGTDDVADQTHTYDVAQKLRWLDSDLGWGIAGYFHKGWAASENGPVVYANGEEVKNLTAVQGGIVHLYTVWAAKTYTVTFNANGGSVSPTSKSVTYNSTYGDLPTPTRTGHTFNGWYTSASGGTSVATGTEVTTASDHTLYARWTANQYTVTFNANGGNVTPASKSVTYDSTYGELPTPTRTDYTFLCWKVQDTDDIIVADTKVTATDNITLVAQWVQSKIVVNFAVQGGDELKSPVLTYDYDSTYGELPTPTRTGYTFKGWYTAASSGTKVESYNEVPNENHTLHAQWEPVSYNVCLNDNFDGNHDDTTIEYDVEFNLETIDSLGWQRYGYTFLGWSTNKNATALEYEDGAPVKNLATVQGEWVILYAVWRMNKNTVNIRVADHVTQSDIEISASRVLLSDPKPNDGGNTSQWQFFKNPTVEFNPIVNVTNNGDKMKLVKVTKDGASISTGDSWSETVTNDLTYVLYYAKSAEIKVGFVSGNDQTMGTLTIDGSEDATLKEVYAGSNVTVSAVAKPGYIFKGWYLDEDGKILYTESGRVTVTVDEDTVLFAKFIQDPEGIYEWEGSSVPKSMEWIGKTYVGSTPFCPATCRIDASGYERDGRKSMLEFEWGMFSSPDGSPERMNTIEISSQDARRLPVMRRERYMQIGVKSDVEIDALFVGTSMGGLVV